MITVSSSSDDSTKRYLQRLTPEQLFAELHSYGKKGVAALRSATPVRTGLTADSWDYRIVKSRGRYSIEWFNTNGQVAILIQYGHGTGTGGYVQGRDYINPAMRPMFDEISSAVWRIVQRS